MPGVALAAAAELAVEDDGQRRVHLVVGSRMQLAVEDSLTLGSREVPPLDGC